LGRENYNLAAMKKEKLFFSIFLMIVLTLVNSSSLHVFAHDQNADDDCIEDCTVCDIAFEIQFDDYVPSDIQNIASVTVFITYEKQNSYKSVAVTSAINSHLFCRPPPTFI